MCKFPYQYNGRQYFVCITIENNGVRWCATTSNYDTDKKWGNCPTGMTPMLLYFLLYFRIVVSLGPYTSVMIWLAPGHD